MSYSKRYFERIGERLTPDQEERMFTEPISVPLTGDLSKDVAAVRRALDKMIEPKRHWALEKGGK